MQFFDGIPAFGHAIAFCDPILGDYRYDQLAADMRHWQSVFDEQAATLGGPLLLTIEIAARAPVIAAYLAALAGGHPVILQAPGQSAGGDVIAARYKPNAVVAMVDGHCTVTRTDAGRAVLHPDLRLLLSTSGTTGDPRLVRLSGENIASNAASIAEYLGLGPADTGITALPLHYSYGMSVLHSHLAVGARLVLTEASVTDPEFARVYRDHRVTNLPLVPHQIDLLAAIGFDYRQSAGLRFVTQAGGRLAPEKVRDMAAVAAKGGWDFFVMYGQTEAGPRIAFVPPADLIANPDTIGRAIPGGRLWVRGADGGEEPRDGIAGELIYEGANVMLGYADTRSDLALGREIEMLCTGDIAERTAAGYFRIIGREKRFVKLYGLRISLDQVEARLAAAGLAGQAVAVGDQLVVMTLPGTDGDAVTALLSEAFGLPRYDITTAGMPDLPTLSSGKPDLRRIAELARDALLRQLAPATLGARRVVPVAELFAEATRVRTVCKDDTFQSLGGDSLSYLHVSLALEERLGTIPAGWDSLTVERLEQMQPAPRPAMGRLEPEIFLRLLATVCVILVHLNLWPVSGGTWLLLVLMGYSLARGQGRLLGEGSWLRVAMNMAYPVLPVYLAFVLSYQLFRAPVQSKMYLLAGNFGGRIKADLLEPLWFISLYAQIVAIILLIFALPVMRRLATARPYEFGFFCFLATMLVSAACRYDPVADLIFQHLPYDATIITMRTPPVCLPLVFLGWMAFHAGTFAQKLLCLGAVVLTTASFPAVQPSYLMLIGLGATWLIFGSPLAMPSAWARLARQAAAATLFVYLLHNTVIHLVKYAVPLHESAGPVLTAAFAVPLCFMVGVCATIGFGWADRFLRSTLLWASATALRRG